MNEVPREYNCKVLERGLCTVVFNVGSFERQLVFLHSSLLARSLDCAELLFYSILLLAQIPDVLVM